VQLAQWSAARAADGAAISFTARIKVHEHFMSGLSIAASIRGRNGPRIGSMQMVALVLVVLLVAVPAAANSRIAAGMPLTAALLQLQNEGLKLVFSSQVVRPSMKVIATPRAQTPREVLAEVLAANGLAFVDGPGGALIIVPQPAAPEKEVTVAPVVLRPAWVQEIVVQPSRIALLTDQAGTPIHLSREEIETVPHLGDDVFRALRLLPGTSTSDLSAQLQPRGARRDELLILMDGQEIYDPYHLKEFDNALSIVSSSTLESVSLATAAFPVSYGDRMGGVLDMTTLPANQKRLRLSAGILGVAMEAGDLHRDGKLGWYAAGRRGSTDLLGRAFHLEQPAFWDFFGKGDLQLGERQSVQLRTLWARDDLSFLRETGKRLQTEYDSSYIWLAHRLLVGDSLFIDTAVSRSHIHRNRRGAESDEERAFDVRDRRQVDVTGLTQSWTLQATPHQLFSGGLEYRHFAAFYDYAGSREFITPLADLRAEPQDGAFGFNGELTSDQTSIYASDRIRPADGWTVELGCRFDHNSLIQDHEISPRLNVAWAAAASSVIRFGWGRFSQSQRPSELMLEDGDTRIYPTERSEHWVLGFEQALSDSFPLPLSMMRVEVYRRNVTNPRPRYENLFAVFDPFPEGDFDRVRFEPVSASGTGLELVVRGRTTPRASWWLNYTLASTTDRLAGRTVPRGIDQRHAVNFDVDYRVGHGWNANVALAFRTGRPVTPLSITQRLDSDGELEVVPVLGPLNSDRLPSYRRVDLRLSRDWLGRNGTFRFFLDIDNVLGQQNVAGLDITVDAQNQLQSIDEYWPRFIASAGISWELR
jgi:hypothetical protein